MNHDLLEFIQAALDDYGDDGGPTCAGHIVAANDPPEKGVLKVILWEEKKFIAAGCDVGLPSDAEFEITVRRVK